MSWLWCLALLQGQVFAEEVGVEGIFGWRVELPAKGKYLGEGFYFEAGSSWR